MAVDVTGEYLDAVLAAAKAQGAGEDKIKRLRSAQLLRSLAAKTDFTKAAIEVANNILALRQYLKENQRDYAQQGKLREAERDRIEEEVGAYVRTCSTNIDRLQQTLAAPQPSPPPGGRRQPAAAAAANKDMAAHRQGMVLILSERLKALTAAFDHLRSLRFQQLQQQEANRRRRLPQRPLPGRPASAASPPKQQPHQDQAQRPPGGGPALPMQPPAQQQQQQQSAPSWAPQTTGQFHQQLAERRAAQAQAPGGGAAVLGEQRGQLKPPSHQQQQALMDPENQALQLELMSMGEQVTHAERTVREIATLNQMFSTTIMHQSEQIEKLYTQAMDASQSITSGNVQLRKAVRTNAGARKYLLAFLLVASLGLLFLDWWSS